MSKRVRIEVPYEDSQKLAKMSKKSLDSDEEDCNEDEFFRLREKDIDGQEGATLEFDDTIKITPFNMKEELEEDGHFDGNGNFIFKKVTDARDNWLEEIDWVEVNRRQQTGQLKETSISDDVDTNHLDNAQMGLLYDELLKLMKPGETVIRCIKRMGGCDASGRSSSASERWSKKSNPGRGATNRSDPDGLLRATELADQLLQAGDFDIYQKTFEMVTQSWQAQEKHGDDAELEALGEALDQKDGDQSAAKKDDDPEVHTEENHTNLDDTAYWHLKYSEQADAALEGPYSTSQLKDFLAGEKFSEKPCVLVRQVDKPNGHFYNIRRIDLELYE